VPGQHKPLRRHFPVQRTDLSGARASTDKPLADKYVKNYIERPWRCQPQPDPKTAPADSPSQAGRQIAWEAVKGGPLMILLTLAAGGLIVLALFLSMLSSTPRTGR